MPKFNIRGQVTISAWTVVEAETPEEALRIAEERAENPVWHSYNTGTDDRKSFCCGDIDGVVLDLAVDE